MNRIYAVALTVVMSILLLAAQNTTTSTTMTHSYTYVFATRCLNNGADDLCVFGQYNPTYCSQGTVVYASTTLNKLGKQGFTNLATTPLSDKSCTGTQAFVFTLMH